MFSPHPSTLIVATLLAFGAAGQSSANVLQIDQCSPRFLTGGERAAFTLRANYAWQQEVRTQTLGVLGQLRLTSGGPAGSELRIRIREGSVSQMGALLREVRVTKAISGWEELNIDLAGLHWRSGDGRPIVLEILAGAVPGATLAGNYTEPPARPAYLPPLNYSGVPFSNGGWRVGFDLWVDPDACLTDLNGDGGVDGADLHAFFASWEAGEFAADINRDGGVDFDDASVFVDAWSNADC